MAKKTHDEISKLFAKRFEDYNTKVLTNIAEMIKKFKSLDYTQAHKLGQNNSKLFMQYDFQKFLSNEMVTYYITTIVFISRIARLLGNVVFGKTYKRTKNKMNIIITLFLTIA